MKGYYSSYGYYGYMPIYNKYILFASELEYMESYYE